MAVAINDTFCSVVKGNLAGTPTVNVFNFRVLSVGTEPLVADVLNIIVRDEFLIPWKPYLSNAFAWESIFSWSYRDLTDFTILPFADTGDINDSEVLPAHVPVSLTFYTATRAIRFGGKRFSGLTEGAIAFNVLDSAVEDGINDDILPAYSALHTGDDGSTWRAVIMQRPVPTIAAPSIGTSALIVSGLIAGIGSQNSRKRMIRA